MSLAHLRRRVDGIDAEIIRLLNRRAQVIVDIGKHKKQSGSAVYVPEREREIYEKISSINKGPLPRQALVAIYREIMSSSFGLEKPLTVAYLGPEFTFTHLASTKKFGSSVSYLGMETIGDVFRAVEKDEADYGVVPIENSIEGAVNYTLDMFVDSDLLICSEIYLEISHNLLSRESDPARLKKIYSVPQVFGQCRRWIEKNVPHATLVEVSSTSKAAEITSRERNVGCIASEQAGRRYGLKLLRRSIEDGSHNVTRFLIIGRNETSPSSNDKTSVMVSIKDKVGALHDILMPFRQNRINLTKIESRPSKTKAWEYYFFIDIEGHHRDLRVTRALKLLKSRSAYLKVLGSYPASGD